MGCLLHVGWTKKCLRTGFCITFLSMLLKVGLLLEGHSSHYVLKLVRLAAEHQVVIFCLPLHTTADSQPLDTTCFKLLKLYWVDVSLHIQVK